MFNIYPRLKIKKLEGHDKYLVLCKKKAFWPWEAVDIGAGTFTWSSTETVQKYCLVDSEEEAAQVCGEYLKKLKNKKLSIEEAIKKVL